MSGSSGVFHSLRITDGEVDRVGWFAADELERLDFHFPEDRMLLLDYLRSSAPPPDGTGAGS